jgi:DNA-binding MarR family transcriptional regulator
MKKDDIRHHRRQMRELHRITGALLGDRACCCGLSLPQCHVLLELEASGTTSLVDLAERLTLDKSTVSRTVDGLVELGMIERSTDAKDRRYLALDLTARGRSTASEINSLSDGNVVSIFSHIPSDRQAAVIDCLDLLIAAIRAADTGGDTCRAADTCDTKPDAKR